MNKNKWKGLLSFDSSLTFILCIGLSIITVITENSFVLLWWKDANVWINDFFVNAIVFVITYTFLKKIKSQSTSFIISYILSLIIGNFIYLDVSNTKFNWCLIVALTENGNTLKRLFWEDNKPRLHAENKSYPSDKIDIYPKELTIQGIALKVVRDIK